MNGFLMSMAVCVLGLGTSGEDAVGRSKAASEGTTFPSHYTSRYWAPAQPAHSHRALARRTTLIDTTTDPSGPDSSTLALQAPTDRTNDLAVLYKLFCRKHPQLERRRALRGWRVV
jgi:hypothetical protein